MLVFKHWNDNDQRICELFKGYILRTLYTLIVQSITTLWQPQITTPPHRYGLPLAVFGDKLLIINPKATLTYAKEKKRFKSRYLKTQPPAQITWRVVKLLTKRYCLSDYSEDATLLGHSRAKSKLLRRWQWPTSWKRSVRASLLRRSTLRILSFWPHTFSKLAMHPTK